MPHSRLWQKVPRCLLGLCRGLGSAGVEGPDEDVHRFAAVSRNYLTPFLDRFLFVAENYLLNYVYQHLSPFAQIGSDRFKGRFIFDEAVLLLT